MNTLQEVLKRKLYTKNLLEASMKKALNTTSKLCCAKYLVSVETGSKIMNIQAYRFLLTGSIYFGKAVWLANRFSG